ncbi:MAG: hypothetical protein HKO59_05325 [Phycisphaerales bacterium]|nr:hypothetical protein [Phycisphaerae bacterium]NNF41474.1 hypothetical protein [Phycisphaerales bacterium]NNM25395.1 hypothetical protein [Phycisphaerales bacterium]
MTIRPTHPGFIMTLSLLIIAALAAASVGPGPMIIATTGTLLIAIIARSIAAAIRARRHGSISDAI